MVRKFERYVPPGYDLKNEFNQVIYIIVANILIVLWSFWSLKNSYNHLFGTENGIGILLSNALMIDFKEVTKEISGVFRVNGIFCYIMIREHYKYFNKETRSIYLMLRLPKRSEYHKRCWILPLAFLALSYLVMILAKVLLIVYYLRIVPLSTWPPGQSMNLWSVIL